MAACTSYQNHYDSYLNAPMQPDVLVSLCQDPALSDAALMTSSLGGATGYTAPNDAALGINARTMQPLYAAASVDDQMQLASQLLPKDLLEASINHSTFGQGYVTVYKKERPPQGIQLIREQIRLPVANPQACADINAPCFGMPDFGPYGNDAFNNGIGMDPRYQAPVYDSAAGTYKYPAVAPGVAPLNGSSASMPVGSTLMSS